MDIFEITIGTYLEFDYINWKGVKGHRSAEVQGIYYGSTKFHKEPQWIMEAYDLDKRESRDFAMKDMANVQRYRY
jgi:hypothetical protein